MLQINLNKTKEIRFEIIQQENVDIHNLDIKARLLIEGVEIGFSGKIINNDIVVDIPPLNELLNLDIKENNNYKIIIEGIDGDSIIHMYEDDFCFNIPSHIKLEMKNEKMKDEKIKLKIKDLKESKSSTINNTKKSMKEKFLNIGN